jgi:anti-sigma factor RsiW
MSEHIEHRLTAFHDGTLTPIEAEHVRTHLECCLTCSAAYKKHLRFEALLDKVILTPAPPAFLWTRVQAHLNTRTPRRLSLGLAGSMVLASAVGIALSFALPATPSQVASEETLWSALDYGLANGPPSALAAFEKKGPL